MLTSWILGFPTLSELRYDHANGREAETEVISHFLLQAPHSVPPRGF